MDTGVASADLSDPGLMVVELSQRGLFRRKGVGEGALGGLRQHAVLQELASTPAGTARRAAWEALSEGGRTGRSRKKGQGFSGGDSGLARTLGWLCITLKQTPNLILAHLAGVRFWFCSSPASTLCEAPWPAFSPGLCQARSCLRAFARAVLPAGNLLPADLLALPPSHCLGLSAVTSSGSFPGPSREQHPVS